MKDLRKVTPARVPRLSDIELLTMHRRIWPALSIGTNIAVHTELLRRGYAESELRASRTIFEA